MLVTNVNETTLQAVMKANKLNRVDALRVFDIAADQKIGLGSAITRLSGESIPDFTNRIEGGNTLLEQGRLSPGETLEDLRQFRGKERIQGLFRTGIDEPTPIPTPEPPAVGTSVVPRARDAKRITGDLGERPTIPNFFREGDQGRLDIAREQRTSIDEELVGILDQKLAIDQELRTFRQGQVGLPEAGRVGAISEAERNVQTRLDGLNRRELVLEVKLRNRNTVINELMKFKQQDFANAVADYNTRFNQAIQIYNVFDREQDEAVRDSKANLDVFASTLQTQIQSGQITFDQITGTQRARIQEMEIQAGLPLGSTLAILSTLRPDEQVMYKGVDDNGDFVYITKGPNGEIRIDRTPGAVAPKVVKTPEEKKVPFSKWAAEAGILGLTEDQARDLFSMTTPPQWFRDKMEQENNQSLLPNILQQMWNEAVQRVSNVVQGVSEGETAPEGLKTDNPFRKKEGE